MVNICLSVPEHVLFYHLSRLLQAITFLISQGKIWNWVETITQDKQNSVPSSSFSLYKNMEKWCCKSSILQIKQSVACLFFSACSNSLLKGLKEEKDILAHGLITYSPSWWGGHGSRYFCGRRRIWWLSGHFSVDQEREQTRKIMGLQASWPSL